MKFREYARSFLEEKPILTGDLFKKSIVSSWAKQKSIRQTNPTELTYFLFDNLYRSIRNDPEKMKITYNTLISLNEKEKNEDMVKHLKYKKNEYFESIDYSIESPNEK